MEKGHHRRRQASCLSLVSSLQARTVVRLPPLRPPPPPALPHPLTTGNNERDQMADASQLLFSSDLRSKTLLQMMFSTKQQNNRSF